MSNTELARLYRRWTVYKSHIFEILVGPSAESFFAHAGVLSRSKVLRKEVEGLWKEKEENKIYWRDWSVGAVEKFLEWLYNSDYTCPYPTKALESGTGSVIEDRDVASRHEEPPIADEILEAPALGIDVGSADDQVPIDEKPSDDFGELGASMPQVFSFSDLPHSFPSTGKGEAISVRPLTCLPDLGWSGCRTLKKLSQAEEYDKWTGHQLWSPAELDYEATFMAHAELYVMACHYMLDELKNMAWQRLRSVLVTIGTPSSEYPVIGNLMTLIHYVYQETGETDEGKDPLRELVTTFAALHFTCIQGPEIDELIRSPVASDAEFIVDLMTKTAQQMSFLESRTSEKDAETTMDDPPDLMWGGTYKSKKKKGKVCSTSAFRSEMFQILVGPSAEPFYAHADILSKSRVLKKKIEGLWKEQQEKKIIWQQWSVRAVEPFFQWLYTGVFSCPEPSKVLEQDSPTVSSSEEDEFGVKFRSHQLHALQLDYENTFMTLAELYIMACKQMLDDLQHKVMHLLGKALPIVDKPLHGSALLWNMMAFIRYVYKETSSDGYLNFELREMLTKWVVQHYAWIQEFVYDLVAALGQKAVRLDNLEAKKRANPGKRFYGTP
ncbi:MAG: hypothetical protein Q9181_005700 [Wetmoreana brouardii]